MLVRILAEAFRRRKRRVFVAVFSVAVGAALAAALFTLSAHVSERITQELRAYGANILVSAETARTQAPAGAGAAGAGLIDENELYKLKTIFWRNNILGFAPYLSVMAEAQDQPVLVAGTWFEHRLTPPPGTRVRSSYDGATVADADSFLTGMKGIAPWWEVEGRWVSDDDAQGAMVGAALAEKLGLRPGSTLTVSHGGTRENLRVAGILSTEGLEENQIFVNLPVAQRLAGVPKGASQVLVSALTTPKDKLAPSLRDKRPDQMTPKEYETWYCTPLVDSISLQIAEALPGTQAGAVRQISEAEGAFASKMELLLALVTGVALVASGLAVMTTMTTSVLERRTEIGLMKAVGANNLHVAAIFLLEAAVVGVLGAIPGYLAGLQLAGLVGRLVFNSPVPPNLTGAVATLLLSVAVALAGASLPVRSAVRLRPVMLLRGG